MSKILLVEAHRPLRQAIVLALFPDHDVTVASTLPDPSQVTGFDAVIIGDIPPAASTTSPEQKMQAAQNWKVPIVWLGDVSGIEATKRDKLFSVKRPIDKETLLVALSASLGSSSAPMGSPANSDSKSVRQTRGSAPSQGNPAVIELVDVVDDEGGHADEQPRTRTKS